MIIESVVKKGKTLVVRTTGAEFNFDEVKSRIVCFQRIPLRRKVAVISGISLKGIHVLKKDYSECRISNGLVVGQESLLTISAGTNATVKISGAYEPARVCKDKPHFLLPDEKGGVGLYVVGNATFETADSWKAGWWVRYKVSTPSRILVSVFPPKPFDWKQSYETMLHSFSCNHPYPSDRELKEWRKYGSVLTLHSWIWKGSKGSQYGIEQDTSWRVARYEPKSDKELRRVIRTAHRLKMKVIPYMSPYYFRGGDTDAFVTAVDEIMKKYDMDGVYFDGVRRSIDAGHEVVRKVREVIGEEGILHMHLSGLPLKKIRCPFIECYADYMIRGEHMGLTRTSARWYVSCYNLSNSIGTFCYDTKRVDKKMIDLILAANARLPFWVQDGTWWNGKVKYHLTEQEKKLMYKEYFPRLAEGVAAVL